MNNPLRKLYDWMMRQARSKHAERGLFVVSVMESSFFPLPPDLMILPMCLAHRERAWVIAGIATAGSVVGALGGYAIGYLLWETIGSAIIGFYHLENHMTQFQQAYAAYGAWIIVIAGFTPIPFKLITIASGVFHFPLLPFLALSAVARAARFYLVAGLLYAFGAPVRAFVEKYMELISILVALLIVGGFVVVKYLF